MLIKWSSSLYLCRCASGALLLWILLCPCCIVIALNLAASSLDASSSTTRTGGSKPRAVVTIAVCAGPDCRVDGSSACIKSFQQRCADAIAANNNNNNNQSILRVSGRSCVGPCGDGPCVMVSVMDADYETRNQGGTKVVVKPQPSKKAISLAPPDIFGSNPKGWYQVRTPEQVQEVLDIACQAAEIDTPPPPKSQQGLLDEEQELPTITSTRTWYDRPRNERKFLQRLMQVTVVLGLAQYDNIGDVQYGVAAGLLLLSTCIIKENIWNTLIFVKQRKNHKK